MQRWGDREIARFTFRIALFARRGLQANDAERWADRLALRDQERDDRRSCLECEHMQRDGGCFAARQRWIPGVGTRFAVMPFVLQRCNRFEWVKP